MLLLALQAKQTLRFGCSLRFDLRLLLILIVAHRQHRRRCIRFCGCAIIVLRSVYVVI